MNIPSPSPAPNSTAILKGAEARGMMQLKGHDAVGGMRASIYNAMPIEGVKRLVEYMREFEAKRG
jgi:phosphoserine aminotransferase